jgi:hypothetical protein
VFETPWKTILSSVEDLAKSHATLSQRIEKDVELPLRNFASKSREMQGMSTIQGNLASMAKEQEAAQEKSDKLSKKGGKASTLKVENATSQLQNANQQWDSQAPFIFESLQALDETRLNHLRDVLTQYQTHEADRIEKNRVTVEQTLGSLLEIDTSQEIRAWSQATVAGKPVTERRSRQLSNAGSSATPVSTLRPPPTPTHTDNTSQRSSEHSARHETSGGKLSQHLQAYGSDSSQCKTTWFSKVPSFDTTDYYTRIQTKKSFRYNA